MKNLFMYFSMSCLILVSCTTEDVTNSNETSESNLLTSLKTVVLENDEDDKFIQYELSTNDNGLFVVENPVSIERTRISETYHSYRKFMNSVTVNFENQTRSGVTVCFTTDGETYECTTCPDTPGQGICILENINACTDNGGCGVVCPNEKKTIIYDPKKLEFVIVQS